MQILINTDHNIEGREALVDQLSAVVESALSRFGERITRVEVHITDQNGDKFGRTDKRCMMEARLAGRQPIVVTDDAATVDEAVDGATGKMIRLIETTLGRVHDEHPKRDHSVPDVLDALDAADRT